MNGSPVNIAIQVHTFSVNQLSSDTESLRSSPSAPSFKGEADPPDQLTLSNVSLRLGRSSTPASDGNSTLDLTFNRVAAELYDWHGGDVTSRKNDRPISALDRTLIELCSSKLLDIRTFYRTIRETTSAVFISAINPKLLTVL